MKKILITGAGGFIGTAMMRYFPRKEYHLRGIDYIDGNLLYSKIVERHFENFRPDIVINLAAQVGIYFNEIELSHTIESNVTLTANISNACKKFGAKLIHTSTSEVYGDIGDRIANEDDPLIGRPTGIYALSKRWSEDIVQEYAPDGWVIIRPSMPYGPGAPPGKGRRAIDNMLWQAHHRKPITVHKGARRSWCWIGDLCRAYELIIDNDCQGKFNAGRDDDEREMLWIAEKACEITGAPTSLIRIIDPPENKIQVKRLGTDKLKKLGWQPIIDIEDGMHLTYDWIKNFEWREEV